jgi:hypothetical protein
MKFSAKLKISASKSATFAKPQTVKGKLEPKLPNGYTIKKNKK